MNKVILCYNNSMVKIIKKCQTLEDTKKLAEKFAELVKEQGCFVNLYGEIGAGSFRCKRKSYKSKFCDIK